MKTRKIIIRAETWLLKTPFVIARSRRTETHVIVVEIEENSHKAWGEGVPNIRYGETIASVLEQIEAVRPLLENGLDLDALQEIMPNGAARNAVDCALWDLRAKTEGRPVNALLNIDWPKNIPSVQTLSIGEPKDMGASAAKLAGFPVLKVKLNGDYVMARLEAVHKNAPHSGILIDANESWTVDIIGAVCARAKALNIVMIEQPLAEGHDQDLKDLKVDVPIGADESCHSLADLDRLIGLYDVINIKLDKAGGLSEALKLRAAAQKEGFGIMVGCMVGTSLSMAPAMFLAHGARFVDLDGPTMLDKDRKYGLILKDGIMSPLAPCLWGSSGQ